MKQQPTQQQTINELPEARPTILIVEDNDDILIILQRVLRIAFPLYSIAIMTNGYDALLFADRAALALVMTDQNMQGMSGVQLTIELRKKQPYLPIVMLTAFPSPDLERRAFDAGVNLFLTKPFKYDELIDHLQTLIPKEPPLCQSS